MRRIDESAIDLNLLRVLDALLAEPSVTAAARRLGIGQPATSHALARLRAVFEDPLFVRSGRGMVPTPRAEALREPLTRVLADARRLVHHRSAFDPGTTDRTFTIVSADLLAPVLPKIIGELSRRAPRARLRVIGPQRGWAEALHDGRGDLLAAAGPIDGPGLRRRGLGSIHFGIVARRDHPALDRRRKLKPKAWTKYPHVVVESGNDSPSAVATAVQRAALERHVALVVPTFLSALVVVSNTDLLFAAPRELVAGLLAPLGLVVIAPPIEIAAIPIAAVWHERYDGDPAHRFFRGLVCRDIEVALSRDGGV